MSHSRSSRRSAAVLRRGSAGIFPTCACTRVPARRSRHASNGRRRTPSAATFISPPGDPPDTPQGQELIAHELAHVEQQSRGGGGVAGAEARADRAAHHVMQGNTVAPDAVGGAPHGVQAKPDEYGSDAPSGLTFPVTTLDAFALNSAALTSGQVEGITRLAWSIGLHTGMLRNPAATITVVGHTDRSGPETINDPLGQSRADAVKQALIDALAKEKVDAAIFGDIPSTSMGESQPVVPTADGVKDEKNRRVEITVHRWAESAPPPSAANRSIRSAATLDPSRPSRRWGRAAEKTSGGNGGEPEKDRGIRPQAPAHEQGPLRNPDRQGDGRHHRSHHQGTADLEGSEGQSAVGRSQGPRKRD